MTENFEQNADIKEKSYNQKSHKHGHNHSHHNCNCQNECKNHKKDFENLVDESEEDMCDCGCENIHDEENCREEEFKETLQRLQAEFENYRKRTDANMVRVKEDGVIFAVNKLLPVLDSFKSAKMLVENEEFLKSLGLVEKQFVDGLSALNISKIEAENQMFNPNIHNAVMTGKDESKQDGEILEVFQDGYKLGDRVIRHSVVKINKL